MNENKAMLYPLLFGGMCKLFSNPWILAFATFDLSTKDTRNRRNRIGSTARSSLSNSLFSRAWSVMGKPSDISDAYPLFPSKPDGIFDFEIPGALFS